MKQDPLKKSFARFLRKNSTDPEAILWYHLRGRKFMNVKFRRQQIIRGFIVDFVSLEKKLIIEIDGPGHRTETSLLKDSQRTNILEKDGFKVVRFWNNDISSDLKAVLERLQQLLFPLP